MYREKKIRLFYILKQTRSLCCILDPFEKLILVKSFHAGRDLFLESAQLFNLKGAIWND